MRAGGGKKESERLDGVPAGHRRERLRVKTKRPPAVLAGGP